MVATTYVTSVYIQLACNAARRGISYPPRCIYYCGTNEGCLRRGEGRGMTDGPAQEPVAPIWQKRLTPRPYPQRERHLLTLPTFPSSGFYVVVYLCGDGPLPSFSLPLRDVTVASRKLSPRFPSFFFRFLNFSILFWSLKCSVTVSPCSSLSFCFEMKPTPDADSLFFFLN